MNFNIDNLSGTTKTMSPLQFIKFSDINRRIIKSVEFIHPAIGQRDFGSFKVHLKHHINYGGQTRQESFNGRF